MDASKRQDEGPLVRREHRRDRLAGWRTADPFATPRLLGVEERGRGTRERRHVAQEREAGQRSEQQPAQRCARSPSVLAQHEDDQGQDQRDPLEPAQDRQRQEDARPGAMPALRGKEGRDHQEQEQALAVGHREDRRERVDDEKTGRDRRTSAAQVRRAEAHEQRQRGEERHVRDEDRHDALGAGDRPRQQPDNERVERRKGDVGIRAAHGIGLVAVPDDARGSTSRPSSSGCAGSARRRPARGGGCAGSAPRQRTRPPRSSNRDATKSATSPPSSRSSAATAPRRSRQPGAGMGTLSDPFIRDRLSCRRAG